MTQANLRLVDDDQDDRLDESDRLRKMEADRRVLLTEVVDHRRAMMHRIERLEGRVGSYDTAIGFLKFANHQTGGRLGEIERSVATKADAAKLRQVDSEVSALDGEITAYRAEQFRIMAEVRRVRHEVACALTICSRSSAWPGYLVIAIGSLIAMGGGLSIMLKL